MADKCVDIAVEFDGHIRGHVDEGVAHLQDIRNDAQGKKDRHQGHSAGGVHSVFDGVRRVCRARVAAHRHGQTQAPILVRNTNPTNASHPSLVVLEQNEHDYHRVAFLDHHKCQFIFAIFGPKRHSRQR